MKTTTPQLLATITEQSYRSQTGTRLRTESDFWGTWTWTWNSWLRTQT